MITVEFWLALSSADKEKLNKKKVAHFWAAFFYYVLCFVYTIKEVAMFGFSSFSEVPISDDGFVRTDPYGGGVVVLHFNKDVLKFPLSINKQIDRSLSINKRQDHGLNINKIINFDSRR